MTPRMGYPQGPGALEHNLLDISLDFFGSKRQLLLAEQVEGLHQNFYR